MQVPYTLRSSKLAFSPGRSLRVQLVWSLDVAKATSVCGLMLRVYEALSYECREALSYWCKSC